MVSGLRIFLDVDDLVSIDRLEQDIAASRAIIVFLSGSWQDGRERSDYFRSANCLREFRAAVLQKKRIVLVVETDPDHGGVAFSTHLHACPADSGLKAALLASPRVEWHRLKHLQDVSLCEILREAVCDGREVYIPSDRRKRRIAHGWRRRLRGGRYVREIQLIAIVALVVPRPLA